MNLRAWTVVLGSALLAACGDGSEKAPSGPVGTPSDVAKGIPKTEPAKAASEPKISSLYLASAKDLPTCDAAHKAMLAYLASEKEFQACDGKAWAVVTIETKPAATATPVAVVPTKIKSITACKKQAGLLFESSLITEFTSGDVHVACSIDNDARAYTFSVFIPASAPGAKKGACLVTYDYNTSTIETGYTSFAYDDSGKYLATHHEADSSSDGTSIELDCAKTDYP